MLKSHTPKEIVKKLDQFIIKQSAAKKAVAIALRNRERRMSLEEGKLREEIHPQNIIMKGPTGVGKTEIARRLAKLVNVPFVKVEATKYTEVGYVGRDVESMVRDLLTESIKMVKKEYEEKFKQKAEENTRNKLIAIICQDPNVTSGKEVIGKDPNDAIRNFVAKKLDAGSFENKEIEITYNTKQKDMPMFDIPGMEGLENQFQGIFYNFTNNKKNQEKKKLIVKQARKLLMQEELDSMINQEQINEEAIEKAENTGIVFIDEIDKIASRGGNTGGASVSREGVQRDILPLIEGSSVRTKFGIIKTNHILFIAAGAFHIASLSDLIPELQGRFPIRVELSALKKEDYAEILKKPKNAISKQYQALLSTENIDLEFVESGYHRIAELAFNLNTQIENIGARRLYALVERVLENVSFSPEEYSGKKVVVDKDFVDTNLKEIISDEDMTKYIL